MPFDKLILDLLYTAIGWKMKLSVGGSASLAYRQGQKYWSTQLFAQWQG